MTNSAAGTMTTHSIASIMRSMINAGKWLAATPDPTPRSSTARASKARKNGGLIDPPVFDAGKKIKGKKRHILVDTQGLLMQAIIHSADIRDRDGSVLLKGALFGRYPSLLKL